MQPQLWDSNAKKWLWQVQSEEGSQQFYYEVGQPIKAKVTRLNLEPSKAHRGGYAQRLIEAHCNEEGLGMVSWGWNLN